MKAPEIRVILKKKGRSGRIRELGKGRDAFQRPDGRIRRQRASP